MRWFESKEDKKMRKEQEERDRIRRQEIEEAEQARQQELEEAEEARQQEVEDERERAEFIEELEDELIGENTDIITIHLCNDANAWRKQIALNFMLKHGYICAQNDVCCYRYYHFYELTFVKKEHADFFKTR